MTSSYNEGAVGKKSRNLPLSICLIRTLTPPLQRVYHSYRINKNRGRKGKIGGYIRYYN